MPTTKTNNSPAQTPYTAAELDERTKYRRAVEAVVWGMPLVNTEAMRHAYLRDVGATYNDICYFSQPADCVAARDRSFSSALAESLPGSARYMRMWSPPT